MGLKAGFGNTFASLDFDEDFQLQILVMMAKDKQFMLYYGSRLLKPNYFDHDIHADVAKVILDFFSGPGKNSKQPNRATTVQLIKDYLKQVPAKAAYYDDYMETISDVYNYPLDAVDSEYVQDKVLQYCQTQACKIAAQQALDLIESGDFDGVPKLFQDAVMVGKEIHDLPTDHMDGFVDRLEAYKTGEDDWGRVPTGIKGVDRVLHGGLGPCELGGVMARINGGKSSILIGFGAAGIRHGENVLHVSMEMAKKAIDKKYDAALTGIPTQKFKKRWQELKDRMYTHVAEMTDASLRVMKKPEGRYSIRQLEADLRLLQMESGFIPNLIIVDYLDRMANNGKWIADRRERYATIWQEFRSLLGILEVPGWTASQKRRGGRGEDAWNQETDDDGDEVADSVDKFAIADVWLSVGQTAQEYKQKIMRLHFAKLRENEKNQTIYVHSDFRTCTFRDVEVEELEELKGGMDEEED